MCLQIVNFYKMNLFRGLIRTFRLVLALLLVRELSTVIHSTSNKLLHRKHRTLLRLDKIENNKVLLHFHLI